MQFDFKGTRRINNINTFKKVIDFVTWHCISKSNLKSLFLNIKSEIIKHTKNFDFYFKLLLENKIDNNDPFIFSIFVIFWILDGIVILK